MTDQSVEELFLSNYCNLDEDHFLGMVIDPVHNDILAKELYKKLPKNTGMAKLFSEMTLSDLKGGLDTVELASSRIKTVLSLVRQSIRIANSHGPDHFKYRFDSRDKEGTSPDATHDYITERQPESHHATYVTAQTPVAVDRCEGCANWGHTKSHCKWSTHPMANNTEK